MNDATISAGEVSVEEAQRLARITEDYYDSDDADRFYYTIWGGEDIHIGLYDTTGDIRTASRLTVDTMAQTASPIGQDSLLLDIGAGYGGAARHLARLHGCKVHCLNISRIQNSTNQRLTAEQGLDDRVSVVHGSFEDIPEPDGRFDLVWSQDAILHSGRREQVLAEAFRVLKPGGRFVFTDPMQADDCPADVLQPVLDRIHLESLGSFAFYRQAARKAGFLEEKIQDLTPNIGRHYARVAEELRGRYDSLAGKVSTAYMDRMLTGLGHWVDAAEAGHLAWGILLFRKPAH